MIWWCVLTLPVKRSELERWLAYWPDYGKGKELTEGRI